MTWRNHETHTSEGKAVKAALKEAGIPVLSVGHGRGTAWGWLKIKLVSNPGGKSHDGHEEYRIRYNCPACMANDAIEKQAYAIVRSVTGRTGEYDGRTIISQRS